MHASTFSGSGIQMWLYFHGEEYSAHYSDFYFVLQYQVRRLISFLILSLIFVLMVLYVMAQAGVLQKKKM